MAAALAYLCYNDDTELACAKDRLHPKAANSIPRKESNEAMIGLKLAEKLFLSRLKDIIFWLDSLSVLGWIKNPPKNAGIFITHRIVYINHLTNITRFE